MRLFSTVSFSVLYSTLILYLTEGLHLKDTLATSIVATFIVFNYALHLLGGVIGGRYLSYRALFAISMVFVMVGCVLLSHPDMQFFYWGLAAFLTGSSYVTCINCMLTQLFHPGDSRRESAFLWNYSAMNIGFFMAISFAGLFQAYHAFTSLFLFCGLGNLAALLIIVYYYRDLGDVNTYYSTNHNKVRAVIIGITGVFGIFLLMRWVLVHVEFSLSFIIFLGVAMEVFVVILAIRQPQSQARKKLWAYFILGLASLVFLTLYQLVPIGLVLFVERNVDRHLFSVVVAPQWYQNINSLIIIFGGPLLSYLFQYLRKRGYVINASLQFSLALILIGLGIGILPIGIAFASQQGLINSGWVVVCYVLLTFGELCITPIGYAIVGELAPAKLRGLLMGVWLMLTGVGGALSNIFSQQMLGNQNISNPLLTNPSFSHTFAEMAGISIASGIILLAMAPWIQHKLIKS